MIPKEDYVSMITYKLSMQINNDMEDFIIRSVKDCAPFGEQITVNAKKIYEACEKQKAKKPILHKFDDLGDTIAYCPTCKTSFGELKPTEGFLIRAMKNRSRFAPSNNTGCACICCGQAIDLTEDDK